MAAPHLTFSITGEKISAVSGFDKVIVAFQSDISYQAFECRATEGVEAWVRGKGALIASFSQTPANTQRQVDVSLYAQGEDGSWNDNYYYIPQDSSMYICADGKPYLCMRE